MLKSLFCAYLLLALLPLSLFGETREEYLVSHVIVESVQNLTFDCAKSPGLDRKRSNINNMGSLTIDQSRGFRTGKMSNFGLIQL